MNEKFFTLPEKKQLAILNAGYRVFSQNCYKKSPVSEIAAAAGDILADARLAWGPMLLGILFAALAIVTAYAKYMKKVIAA